MSADNGEVGDGVTRRRALLPLAALALAAGCGGGGISEADLKRSNESAVAAAAGEASASAAQASRDAVQASLQAEVEKLKSAAASPPPPPAPAPDPVTAAPAPAAPKASTTSCGDNVSAGGSTSCAFALNVAYEWRYYGNGTSTVTAYSPVTQEYIDMRCVAGVPVVCKGGRAAVVYIR